MKDLCVKHVEVDSIWFVQCNAKIGNIYCQHIFICVKLRRSFQFSCVVQYT